MVGDRTCVARRGCREGGKPVQEAPLFRVFLKDGTTLVSYGELARVGDRVVFSMPTSASMDNPNSISSIFLPTGSTGYARRITPSRRAPRDISRRARKPITRGSPPNRAGAQRRRGDDGPAKRLAIVERARRRLADWPPSHYNYKQSDVRQMLGMLDEAIADLRAATGAQRFDLNLVAIVDAPPPLSRCCRRPAQETIEQTLRPPRSPIRRRSGRRCWPSPSPPSIATPRCCR